MATPRPLPVNRLHATFDPDKIPWPTSARIPESRASRTGRSPFQPRAMRALDLALQIREPGYHVYLSGESNLGRRHLVESYLRQVARHYPTPPDLVHVHNFQEPDMPLLLSLPAGVGKKLRDAMKDFIHTLGEHLERRMDTVAFVKQRSRLMDEFQATRAGVLQKMAVIAQRKGFNLEMDNEGGIALSPLSKGKKLNEDDICELDASAKIEFRSKGNKLAKNLSIYMRELNRAEESLRESERTLEDKLMRQTLETLLAPLEKKFAKLASSRELEKYFKDLRADIIARPEAFFPQENRKDEGHENPLNRYAINLFVDNSQTRGAPLIVDSNPNPANLLGCLERESEMGALVTDVTLIRAGSLQKANGGFLVIHAEDILQHPPAWEGLLRNLRSSQARIEEWSDMQEGTMRAKSLHPQPAHLDLKVILIGDEAIYEYLLEHDDRFTKLFRIKAHLTDMADRTPANIRLYLAQLADICRACQLMPFDAAALAWLIDLGSHISEDQRKLSLKFPLLREVMIEANALAQMEGKTSINPEIMEKVYSDRAFRANLIEDAFMEEYDRQMIKLSTSGTAIGQVNGLSVTYEGDYEFGLPHRISCTVGVGHEGIIDLEREAELGGPIHTKAMMILKSYLTNMFARKKPLVLSASLYFEQSYAGIEGDSASGAELVALLSALAEVPVRLDLAFTGAVSHAGQILAVGGVTRKIEGFYKVCARHGLTGKQGVIIPADNVDHLMLSPEVLNSVTKGEFAIYSVNTMEEALMLLTGLPVGKRRKNDTFTPGSLFDLVDRRLEILGLNAQNAFRRPRKEA